MSVFDRVRRLIRKYAPDGEIVITKTIRREDIRDDMTDEERLAVIRRGGDEESQLKAALGIRKQRLVAQIARDPDILALVRLAMIDRLEDDTCKADIALGDYDPSIAVFAAVRIRNDRQRLRLFNAKYALVRLAVVPHIEDERVLRVFSQDPHADVRRMAQRRLNAPSKN